MRDLLVRTSHTRNWSHGVDMLIIREVDLLLGELTA